MHLEFQIIETACQWAQAARLSTQYWPEDPIDAERLHHYASEFPADNFSLRVLAMDGEEPIAYIRLMQSFWLSDRTRCACGIAISRMGNDIETYKTCLDWIEMTTKEKDFATMAFTMRSDDLHLIQILTDHGFQKGQVNPVSVLETDCFEAANYSETIQQVANDGYETYNLNEFARRYPSDWKERLYDWDMTVTKDVPMPGEFEGIPFETYVTMIESPTVCRDAHFVVVKDDVVAAATEMNWNTLDRTIANTGLTGVRREHRRKGLATVAKVTSIDWAKGVGIKRIYTDNEENNPMYGLNVTLGYRKLRDLVDYTRAVR